MTPQSGKAVELRVRRTAQVLALASPVRQALVDLLRRRGPRSARELAELLGREPATLYYHLRALERAELVAIVERRVTGRRPEAVYGLLADRVRLDNRRRDAGWRRALQRLIRSHLRAVERGLVGAVESGALDPDDPSPVAQLRGQRVRLNPTDRAGLQERLDELTAFLEAASRRAREDAPVLDCIFAIAPARGVGDSSR